MGDAILLDVILLLDAMYSAGVQYSARVWIRLRQKSRVDTI